MLQSAPFFSLSGYYWGVLEKKKLQLLSDQLIPDDLSSISFSATTQNGLIWILTSFAKSFAHASCMHTKCQMSKLWVDNTWPLYCAVWLQIASLAPEDQAELYRRLKFERGGYCCISMLRTDDRDWAISGRTSAGGITLSSRTEFLSFTCLGYCGAVLPFFLFCSGPVLLTLCL